MNIQYGNLQGQLIELDSYSTSISSQDITNEIWSGAHILISVDDGEGITGTWTPKIQGKDPVTEEYYDILVGADLTTGMTRLLVYPGMSEGTNLADTYVNDFLPRTWRFHLEASIGATATLSVGMQLKV